MEFFTSIKSSVLDNGVRVITAQRQSHQSMVAIAINSGSNDEPNQLGVAHFLEHMVFNGTANRDNAVDINSEVETLGSSINAYTSSTNTVYMVSGLGEYIPNAIDILSDIVANPALKDISKERDVILQEYYAGEASPQRSAYSLLKRAAYPTSRSGIDNIGTEKSIEAISNTDLLEYHAANYYGDNMIVFVGGNIEHEAAVELVKASHVSKIPAGKTQNSHLSQDFIGGAEIKVMRDDDTCVSYIGYKVPANQRFYAWMLMDVLSGGMSSPLFVEVREKLGLCYYIDSTYDSSSELFIIKFQTTKKNLKKCYKKIMETLDSIVKSGFQDKWWDLALNKAKTQISETDENFEELMGTLFDHVFREGEVPENVGFLLEKSKEISRESIHAFLCEMVQQEVSISLVGDVPGKIKKNQDVLLKWYSPT